MRAVVQRVAQARVRVNGQVTGEIGPGIVALWGAARVDTQASAAHLAEKIAGLRLFNDAEGKMNLSLEEVGGAVLAISQFTLYGDTRQGRRPSFDRAAPAQQARALPAAFVAPAPAPPPAAPPRLVVPRPRARRAGPGALRGLRRRPARAGPAGRDRRLRS